MSPGRESQGRVPTESLEAGRRRVGLRMRGLPGAVKNLLRLSLLL